MEAWTAAGATMVRVGTGLLMTRVRGFELPPPGGGLMTTICRFPEAFTSSGSRVAVRVVGLLNVVVRLAPLMAIVESETKFEPVTVIWDTLVPASTLEGLSEEMTGTGLLMGLIVKFNAGSATPPPGCG